MSETFKIPIGTYGCRNRMKTPDLFLCGMIDSFVNLKKVKTRMGFSKQVIMKGCTLDLHKLQRYVQNNFKSAKLSSQWGFPPSLMSLSFSVFLHKFFFSFDSVLPMAF